MIPQMKIASWNVNSLKVRLSQVLSWLDEHQVDALGLQELKLADEFFPVDAFREIGYHAVWSGQRTYNGVAIISRHEGADTQRDIPGFEDPQKRVIATTLPTPAGNLRLINAYCPNGQSVGSEKYEYKLQWFQALHDWLKEELVRYPQLIIVGDYNVAPKDEDVHDPAKWEGQVLVSEPERAAFQALLNLGLSDSFRLFPQPEKSFSWWDYRRFAFRRNAGLRIDHILVSEPLKAFCVSSHIDAAPRALEQPSDHAPVVTELDFSRAPAPASN